jgi:predicted DNA binding CopG/RHH family protein
MVKLDLRKLKRQYRDNRVELLLSSEERDILIQKAAEEGLPLSTYCRWKLLKKSV